MRTGSVAALAMVMSANIDSPWKVPHNTPSKSKNYNKKKTRRRIVQASRRRNRR